MRGVSGPDETRTTDKDRASAKERRGRRRRGTGCAAEATCIVSTAPEVPSSPGGSRCAAATARTHAIGKERAAAAAASPPLSFRERRERQSLITILNIAAAAATLCGCYTQACITRVSLTLLFA